MRGSLRVGVREVLFYVWFVHSGLNEYSRRSAIVIRKRDVKGPYVAEGGVMVLVLYFVVLK